MRKKGATLGKGKWKIRSQENDSTAHVLRKSCNAQEMQNPIPVRLKVKITEIETFTKFEGFPNLLFLSGLCAYSKHIKQG